MEERRNKKQGGLEAKATQSEQGPEEGPEELGPRRRRTPGVRRVKEAQGGGAKRKRGKGGRARWAQ